MNYKLLSLRESGEWSKLLKELPIHQQDIYYTPEYYSIFEKKGEGKATCFVYQDEKGIALYPFLINSINKLGYSLDEEYFDIQGAYGYNGVVSSSVEDKFINDFYKSFDSFCLSNNIIAEFTRYNPILNNKTFASKGMRVIKDRETVFVNLSKSYGEIWANQYSSQNRNKIRKALKDNYKVKIYEHPSKSKIELFIRVYQNSMRSINADYYYLFNRDFFFNTFKFLKDNIVLLEIINSEQKVECVSIILFNGIYGHYHLSGRVSGSNNSVNNLLLDEAIKLSIKNGIKYFHFGGGTTSDLNDNLLKFKSNFSKEKAIFHVGKLTHNQKIYDQVVQQWKEEYPLLYEKNKNRILGYREI